MYKLSRLLLKLSVIAALYVAALAAAMYWPASFLPLLLAGVLLAKRKRTTYLTTLGSARWAGSADLRQAGMLDAKHGLCVGHLLGDEQGQKGPAVRGLFRRDVGDEQACQDFLNSSKKSGCGPLVRLPNAVHTAVFSPSGGGKGTAFIIPFLKSCKGSCFINDPKGENAKLTGEFRRARFGHRIVLLDPFKEVTQTPDQLNPLDFIDKDSPTAIDDCVDLAKALVVRTGEEKDPHFNDAAEMFICGVLAMVVFYGNAAEGTRSLQTLREILSHPDKLQKAIQVLIESPFADGILARMGGNLLHFVDKEKSSVLTSAARHLRFLDTLAIAASTKTSTFDPDEVHSGKLTIFMILPPNRLRGGSALSRVWLTTFFRAVVRGGLQEKQLTHVLLDECASFGRLELLEDALTQYRGYGLRMQFYFQSCGQLQACFPDGGHQVLLSNTTQIFMGVNDVGLPGGAGTGDMVSARLGDKTIVVNSGGKNSGKSSQWSHGGGPSNRNIGRSSGDQDNWQLQARKLLQPAEVAALSPRIALTFAPGVPPIKSWPVRYYEMSPDQTPVSRSHLAIKASKTFVMAVILFGLSAGLALRATQRALQLRDERSDRVTQPYHFETFRDDPPDVPAGPTNPLSRSPHVEVGRTIVPRVNGIHLSRRIFHKHRLGRAL